MSRKKHGGRYTREMKRSLSNKEHPEEDSSEIEGEIDHWKNVEYFTPFVMEGLAPGEDPFPEPPKQHPFVMKPKTRKMEVVTENGRTRPVKYVLDGDEPLSSFSSNSERNSFM